MNKLIQEIQHYKMLYFHQKKNYHQQILHYKYNNIIFQQERINRVLTEHDTNISDTPPFMSSIKVNDTFSPTFNTPSTHQNILFKEYLYFFIFKLHFFIFILFIILIFIFIFFFNLIFIIFIIFIIIIIITIIIIIFFIIRLNNFIY